jgi:hypothetical protein
MSATDIAATLSDARFEDYQLWAHGFALTASLYHSRHVLALLEQAPKSTPEELRVCAGYASSGHLAIMLRTLSTLGWVTRTADGRFTVTSGVAAVAASPVLSELCDDVYAEAVPSAPASSESSSAEAWGQHLPRLAKWLARLQSGLTLPAAAADVPHLLVMLAGAVIAPCLLELRMMSRCADTLWQPIARVQSPWVLMGDKTPGRRGFGRCHDRCVSRWPLRVMLYRRVWHATALTRRAPTRAPTSTRRAP